MAVSSIPLNPQSTAQRIFVLQDMSSGIGAESAAIKDRFQSICLHANEPYSRLSADIELKFHSLSEKWKQDTWMLSSTTQMVMHPAYQEIIGLGRRVLPLILNELQKDADYWFWALRAITGENPVTSKQLGKIGEMSKAWLHWGEEHQLL